MGRAPCCDKASVKRGPWSPEEDELLRSYVRSHGTGGNWIALPQKAGAHGWFFFWLVGRPAGRIASCDYLLLVAERLAVAGAGLNRCGKSCRLRWLNYLRPDIKHGGYTEQEDRIICSLYNSIGSRWSIIASKLPGRTDNDVKNYWNTKLKKKAMTMHQPPPPQPQPQQQHYHPHRHGAGGRVLLVSTPPPPPPALQSQCVPSMQPSPASAASSAVTTASGDTCSFATMYPPSPSHPQSTTFAGYTSVSAAQPSPLAELIYRVPPPTAAADCWTSGVALDDVFLPELIGSGGDFPNGDLFGGFGQLLQDRSSMELSACYLLPNPQSEIWAAADHVKPAGLCHSLT
ncbi:hypothetical protein GUJ93_ZPchr0007g5366 [Zizania palustris]|uniref:Uncharacterized protein n=1 Tax=Zizania palustris TaxID=103762 RepID=A0A8J5W581_ZIZPA|nr:hypothetical protein GUJ93_ZPchr0007g5366 [Zizania palustris]